MISRRSCNELSIRARNVEYFFVRAETSSEPHAHDDNTRTTMISSEPQVHDDNHPHTPTPRQKPGKPATEIISNSFAPSSGSLYTSASLYCFTKEAPEGKQRAKTDQEYHLLKGR